MPALDTGVDFVGGADALAAEVNARFDAIETWANTTKLDSANIQTNAIIESLIADGAVSLDKLSASLQAQISIDAVRDYAEVLTEETTNSTSWADLATVGPSVTLTAPSGGLLVVAASALIKGSGFPEPGYVGVHVTTDRAISGSVEFGETIFQSDDISSYTSLPLTGVMAIPVTAGSRTIALKYRSPGGDIAVKDRKLFAMMFGGF